MTNVLEQLATRRRQKPFAPFAIVLQDGRRIPVNRPLQYAFHEQLVVVLDNDDHVIPFKPTEIVDFEELHSVA